MEGFLIFLLIVAAIVMLFRYMRKREIEAFRQADMGALDSFNSEREKAGMEPVTLPDEALIARAAQLVKVPEEKLEVELRKGLFDEIHHRFFLELEQAVGGKLRIFVHVPVNSIVRAEAEMQNRLSHKTVSFVLCEPASLSVVAAIQLKNAGAGAQQDQELKTRIFEEVELPLLSYPMIGGISAAEILDQLGPVLEKREIVCPDCGGDMQIRKVSRGKNAGQSFKVCQRYPSCKGRFQISGAN